MFNEARSNVVRKIECPWDVPVLIMHTILDLHTLTHRGVYMW